MYYLTPFRYLLSGFISVLVHNVPVVCADNEFAKFTPPPNQSCTDYVAGYIAQAGGYVVEDNGLCKFCQYKDGDEFAAGLNIFYSTKWQDYGVFWAYCVFNFMVVFLCSWLYLGGWAKLRKRLDPRMRSQEKALEKKRRERSGEAAA